jgi:hypothetical protein
MNVDITPAPGEEEAAAIVAAVEVLWPKPLAYEAQPTDFRRNASWRFSRRWWARPLTQRRDRPYY